MRTRDAAVSLFYAADARDCACGCGGGCHGTFDGQRVFDAALKALTRDEAKGAAKPGAGGKGEGLWPNYWRKKRHEHLQRAKS